MKVFISNDHKIYKDNIHCTLDATASPEVTVALH